MGKRTVKRRIFVSNALMVFVTLALFLLISVFVLKIYSESIETELKASVEAGIDADGWDDWIEEWTIHRDEFLLLFLAEGMLGIAVLVVVSQFFTRNLVRHIMEPLDALSAGAERIRNHDLTQDISYEGERE
ncbi:hypothetical protein BRYFOR_09774, partial [Marvinbryantia formatexigens DSM 14469]